MFVLVPLQRAVLAEGLIALVANVLAFGVRLLLAGVGRRVEHPLRHVQHRLHLKQFLLVVLAVQFDGGFVLFQIAPGPLLRPWAETIGADWCAG